MLDTSIWIAWARGRQADALRAVRGRLLLMPAVVSMELWSGARTTAASRAVERLLRPFVHNRRILLPVWDDFRRAGEVMADLQWAASRRANDVLIAVLARRAGADLWTANLRDFRPICRALKVPLLGPPLGGG